MEHRIFLEDGDRAARRRASSLSGAKPLPDRPWFGLSYFSHQNTEGRNFHKFGCFHQLGSILNVVVMLCGKDFHGSCPK